VLTSGSSRFVMGEVPGSGIPDAVYMIDTETGRVWIFQGNLKEVKLVEIERVDRSPVPSSPMTPPKQ